MLVQSISGSLPMPMAAPFNNSLFQIDLIAAMPSINHISNANAAYAHS